MDTDELGYLKCSAGPTTITNAQTRKLKSKEIKKLVKEPQQRNGTTRVETDLWLSQRSMSLVPQQWFSNYVPRNPEVLQSECLRGRGGGLSRKASKPPTQFNKDNTPLFVSDTRVLCEISFDKLICGLRDFGSLCLCVATWQTTLWVLIIPTSLGFSPSFWSAHLM